MLVMLLVYIYIYIGTQLKAFKSKIQVNVLASDQVNAKLHVKHNSISI